MPQTRTCPRGHEWDGDPADCPGCADDSWNQSAGSTFNDELPPPPRSVRMAPAPSMNKTGATPSAAFPIIPGYELIDELGRGGMGVVYRARQRSLNRLVALKVIACDEPREWVRFRHEAESVGRLQHPNIVQVHEIGASDGREYFAMELVPGGTLAQALLKSPLDARTAAGLVETLARAVDYAHSQGIIHRDLKPGNILLTGTGSQESGVSQPPELMPKIADFGLAKRIGDDSGQTTTGVVVGTPSYMAPEQAAGLRTLIGPACDIYALGAILYELLTGRPPFRAASPVETLQQVLAIDPVAPARVQPGVPRDLETICLKCLQKEARKRYSSAAALSDDLRRFLDGKPILARRTPAWERTAKWARRRPAVAALLVLLAGALIGLGVLGYSHFRSLERHNREITKERDEAKAQRDLANDRLWIAVEAVEQMLKRVGMDRLASVPYFDRTRAQLLEDALVFFDRLIAAETSDPRLLLKQAHALERTGSIHLQLGRFDEARGRYARALAVLDQLPPIDDPATDTERKRLRGLIRNNLGLLLTNAGKRQKARDELEAALAIRESLLATSPADPELRYDVAASNVNLARVARLDGDSERAILHLNRALPAGEELTRSQPDNPEYAHLYALTLNDLAANRLEGNEFEHAISLLEKGLAVWRKLAALDPRNLTPQAELARTLSNLGTAWAARGYVRRGLELHQESLAIRERHAREHPGVRPFAIDLGWSQLHIGELHRARGESDQAIDWFTRAIAGLEQAVKDVPEETLARVPLRNAYESRADVRIQLKRYADALADLARAVELAEGPIRLRLRMRHALILVQNNEVDKAVAEANELAEETMAPADVLFDAARVLAVSSKKIADQQQGDRFAARAVQLLGRLREDGYFQVEAHRAQLDRHADLAALRGRVDFKALRAKMDKH